MRQKRVYTIGITVKGETLFREGEDGRGMRVSRVIRVYGNPEKSAEARSWLDAVKSGLASRQEAS